VTLSNLQGHLFIPFIHAAVISIATNSVLHRPSAIAELLYFVLAVNLKLAFPIAKSVLSERKIY